MADHICNNCLTGLSNDEVVWGPEQVFKLETGTWGLSEDKPWCAKCACVDEDECDGEPLTRTEYWDNYDD